METNTEQVVEQSTQKQVVEEKATNNSSFDADAFFESLSKRADDFFTNNASKQLEKKYGMSDRTSAAELLCSEYWRGMSDISEIATEGLIEKGGVSKITSYIVTHNKIEKIGD